MCNGIYDQLTINFLPYLSIYTTFFFFFLFFFFFFFFFFLFFFFVLMSSVIHFFQIQLKSFAIDPGSKGLLFQNIWHCYRALHLDSRRCTQNTKPRDNVGIAMPLARIGPIRLKRRVFFPLDVRTLVLPWKGYPMGLIHEPSSFPSHLHPNKCIRQLMLRIHWTKG